MTSCSLVANGLVSQYSGQVPTFSYRQTGHSDDYFGIQMTYMNGASTCYSGRPSFTPVIQNTAAGFSVQCQFVISNAYSGIYCPSALVTQIPNGVLTVSYKNWYANQPTPVAFPATFGPSPTPRAVTATAGAVATSIATQTSTVSPGYASTATVYAASATQTYTNTIVVTQTQTTTNTNYVSSCAAPPVISGSSRSSSSPAPSPSSNPASSASQPPSSPSSTVSSASPSASAGYSCPADNGKYVSTSSGTFQITCNYDRGGVTQGLFQPGNGLLGCINLCAEAQGCVWSTYFYAQDYCYLKFGTGDANYNTAAWGAKLITAASSTPVSSTSNAILSPMSSQVATSSPSPSNNATPSPSPSPSSSLTPSQSTSSSRSSSALLSPSSSAASPSSSVVSSSPLGASPPPSPSPSPQSSGISSPSSRSTVAPSPSSPTLQCPGNDAYIFTVGSKSFQIYCSYYRDAATTGPFHPGNGIAGCITLCANTQDCVWSTYYAAQNTCYLNFGDGVPNYNKAASGAKWINPPASSSIVPSPAPSSTSTSLVAASPSAAAPPTPGSPVASPSSSPAASRLSSAVQSPSSTPAASPSSTSATHSSSPSAVSPSSTAAPSSSGTSSSSSAAQSLSRSASSSSSLVASSPWSAATLPSSSAARSSSGAAVASSASSVVSPTVTSTSISCPADDGETVNTPSGAFVVECYIDRSAFDLGVQYPDGGFNGCIQLCASTANCADVSYNPNGPCYLKSGLGTPNPNSGVWGARSAANPISSTAVASSQVGSSAAGSTAIVSSPAATSTGSADTPICPAADEKIFYYNGDVFLVECYTDYAGGDLASGTPQYFSNFGDCVNACATNKACNAVSYVGGTCYLKGTANPGSTNPSVWGARQIGTYDTSTTQITMGVSSSAAAISSAAASSSVVTSTSVSSSSAALPSSSGTTDADVACPRDNGKTFTTSAGTFAIECYVDRNNNDMGAASSNPTSYADCMNACAATTGCLAVSYIPDGPCYLKNGIGSPNSNTGIWGASLSSVASSSSAGTTATATSSAPVATTSVVCPDSDGQTIITSAGTFLVECSIDRGGNDMSNSPVYPSSYEDCIAVCAARDGCMDVSYIPNGPCYLKADAGDPSLNSGVIGGRLIRGPQSSSSAVSFPTMASSLAGPSSSVAVSPSVGSSSTAASSPIATSGAGSPVQTVTVTTTIAGTGYQCACTPTSGLGSGPASSTAAAASASLAAALGCPSSDGSTFTSDCGSTYAIECYSDRYGEDIPGGTSYTNTLNECITDCDNTNGCVDVSYIPGSPGPCYKKSSIAEIRQNNNIFGARQLTQCTASTQLKLHRKRVVRSPTEPEKIQKRGIPYGPDYTYTQGTTTTTQTTTSTSVRTTTITTTPASVGTSTRTVYTTASTTATVTSGATVTQTRQTTVTTCPAVTRRAIL